MMMKFKPFAIGSIALALIFGGVAASLAHGNGRGDAKATIGKTEVSIDYGRPTLKGRDMLKKISPGQIWRLGSDTPTTIESNTDLDFGGTRVPKGKHILLARLVEAGKWTLVVSSKSAMQYEPSAKLAEVPMELSEVSDPVEELTIKVSNDGGRGVIEVTWGTSRLTASFAPAK
jgi:membrane fusion protein, copper/silver efflux system